MPQSLEHQASAGVLAGLTDLPADRDQQWGGALLLASALAYFCADAWRRQRGLPPPSPTTPS